MKRTYRFNIFILIIVLTISNIFTSVLPVYATTADVISEELSSNSEPAGLISAHNWPTAPDIVGEAAILIEADSGVVLYEKNSHASMYPASLTKLLTALLVLENCELDEMVYFSANAVFSLPSGSSHIAINPGEYLSVEHCLYGLLLASANEVANALAEHVGGSVSGFAEMMNARMKELGALGTNFLNPSGLHEDEHYTTCHDMALLCRTLLQDKTFLKIDGTPSYIIPPTNLQPLKRPLNTTHKLLRRGSTNYSGAFGGKTGHTDIAGNTLITFAERNGMTLICIVMKSDPNNIYSDTTSLLDYGFSNFKKINISETETAFNFTQNILDSSSYSIFNNPNPTLSLSEDSYVYVPAGVEFEDLEYTLATDNNTDNIFAKLLYTYNEHYVGEAYLLTTPIDSSDISEADPVEPIEDEPLRIIEILPIHIVSFVVALLLIITWIIYLKLSRVKRIRRKQIRRQKKLQRKKKMIF